MKFNKYWLISTLLLLPAVLLNAQDLAETFGCEKGENLVACKAIAEFEEGKEPSETGSSALRFADAAYIKNNKGVRTALMGGLFTVE